MSGYKRIYSNAVENNGSNQSYQNMNINSTSNTPETDNFRQQAKMSQAEREEQISQIKANTGEQPPVISREHYQPPDNVLNEQAIRAKYKDEIEKELKESWGPKIQEELQRQQERRQQNIINFNQNLSVEKIAEMYQSEPDGYHILEVDRILKSDPSLTLEQARRLANSNGCGEGGSNDMCPIKVLGKETFKQKGNCTGGKCKVSFSDENTTESFSTPTSQSPITSKIKELMITFYSSPNCGFCSRAKELLASQNLLDDVIVLENQPLPEGVRGYPHFVSGTTLKSHTGCPSSLEALVQKLS